MREKWTRSENTAHSRIMDDLDNLVMVTRNPLVCNSTRTPVRKKEISCARNGPSKQHRGESEKVKLQVQSCASDHVRQWALMSEEIRREWQRTA